MQDGRAFGVRLPVEVPAFISSTVPSNGPGIESQWGGARFSMPVKTGPRAHLASCTMGTGSFPGIKSDRGVTLTPHPLLVPWSWKGRAIPLLALWAVQPVQSLGACTKVHVTVSSRVDDRSGPPVMSKFLSRLKKDPEYCPLSQERNPARNNRQQILVFCTYGEGALTHGTSRTATSAATPLTASTPALRSNGKGYSGRIWNRMLR